MTVEINGRFWFRIPLWFGLPGRHAPLHGRTRSAQRRFPSIGTDARFSPREELEARRSCVAVPRTGVRFVAGLGLVGPDHLSGYRRHDDRVRSRRAPRWRLRTETGSAGCHHSKGDGPAHDTPTQRASERSSTFRVRRGVLGRALPLDSPGAKRRTPSKPGRGGRRPRSWVSARHRHRRRI